MHSLRFCIVLALQAAVLPTASSSPLAAPQELNFDDVIVTGLYGRTAVIKESEYQELKARRALPHAPYPAAAPARKRVQPSQTDLFTARSCDESAETQVLSDTSFTDWDMAISPVVEAPTGGGNVTVGVTSGYTIANRLVVKTGGILKMVLKAIMGDAFPDIDQDKTWSTTQTMSINYKVPEGQYGVIVSQPWVRRIEGNVFSGCTDAWETSAFTQDSYSSASYGNLNWVRGIIRLCNSSTYPIPYCSGTGSHQ